MTLAATEPPAIVLQLEVGRRVADTILMICFTSMFTYWLHRILQLVGNGMMAREDICRTGQNAYRVGRNLAADTTTHHSPTPPDETTPQWLLQQQMTDDVGILETTETMERACIAHRATRALMQQLQTFRRSTGTVLYASTTPTK